MIAVTFALPAESSDFVRRLRNRSPRNEASKIISGQSHGKDVVVLHTGVGPDLARESVASFLNENSPSLLLSAGFVGGLNHELKVGELLLAANFATTPRMLAAAKTALYGSSVRVGKLATAPAMIDSLGEREELAHASKAVAVDMETESIAEICAAASIPMLSLRAVTDTPEDPFPAPSHILFDLKTQETNMRRLGLYLATHPFRIHRFVAFGRRVASARRALADGLELLLGSDPRG